MEPRVAVLLAAFNGRQWLNEQIQSILTQEEVVVSLYISVDQSRDGTEDFVDQLSKHDPRIHVLPHGQRYGGAAPNFYQLFKAVNFRQYDFIALSDQDDTWLPKKIITAIKNLQESKMDAYSSNITAFWPDGKKLLIDKAQKQVQWDFLFEAAGPGCTYVFTKNFALDVQKFIIANWDSISKIGLHDWLIYAYARSNGYRWFIDPYSSMLYRQHATNQVGANVGTSAFLVRAKKVLNGWGLDQSLQIANAIGLGQNSFVSTWSKGSRLGYLLLGCQFWKCRRRMRDKFLFLMACICLTILPPQKISDKAAHS